MPVDIPYYALELTFRDNDSVDINNGVEKYRLPYVKEEGDCTFKIIQATQFGDMFFAVAGDSILHLFDSAWTKVQAHTLFSKNNYSTKSNYSFENFMNECVIAGSYALTVNEKTTPVYFLPNGQVSGLKPYLSYSLCYAGDCLEETAEPSNLIALTDDKGTHHLFSIKMPEGKNLIQFYKVGDAIPGVKGERSIGALTFELKSDMSTQ